MDNATRRAIASGRVPLGDNSTLHFHADGTFTVDTAEDCAPVIEQATMERREFSGSRGKNWVKLGSVPDALLAQWAKEDPEVMTDTRKLMAKLRERDYSKLLSAPAGYVPKAARSASRSGIVDVRGNPL